MVSGLRTTLTLDRSPSANVPKAHVREIRLLIFPLVCVLATLGRTVAVENPDAIAAHIFLGQAYSSGHVYLKPFPLPHPSQSEDDYVKEFSWPDSIAFHALSSTHSYAHKIRKARLLTVMHDGQREVGPNAFQLESAYIPALESMDDAHEGCTKELYKPRNHRFEYLSDDFFDSAAFNCNPNEGIAVYESRDLAIYSFSVIAFDSQLPLADIRLARRERPLTSEESAVVAKDKLASTTRESECTTVSRYLDSAKTDLSAKVQRSDISIRISDYETPGCGGHLTTVFLLDIIKSGVVLKTYRLAQYKGAI
jgi:hypothetical protein